MGARGPRSAPTSLKIVKGERPDRINHAEPIPSGEAEPPEWLQGEGLEIWNHYAPDLIAKKVLTGWDGEGFAVWCSWATAHREAVRDIARLGELIDVPVFDRHGNHVGDKIDRNPACITRREASDQLLRYGARFGLTPSDRTAIKVDSGAKGNNKARLLTS
jgi:P27 family predicted phage terminase small subunit